MAGPSPRSPRGILRQPSDFAESSNTPSSPTASPLGKRSSVAYSRPTEQRHTPRNRFASLPAALTASRTQTPGNAAAIAYERGTSHASAERASTREYERDRVAVAAGQQPSPRIGADSPRMSPAVGKSDGRVVETKTPRMGPTPSYMPRENAQWLIRALDVVLRSNQMRLIDHFDLKDIAASQKREAEYLRTRDQAVRIGTSEHVFGETLEYACLYASAPTTFGNYQHDLPIVVVACVEELYRTGLYQHGLFRTLPDRERHLELIQRFNTRITPNTPSPRDFGAACSLRKESMPDICALLTTYLSSLPTTVLDSNFYGCFWSWCVKPSMVRENERREREDQEQEEAREHRWGMPIKGKKVKKGTEDLTANRYYPPAPPPKGDDEVDLYDVETCQIQIAQLLFKLLPTPNFSLLVYLCAFFTQIPTSSGNGLTLDDLARLFGHKLLGGSKPSARRMMLWILTRWWRILEGLVDTPDQTDNEPLSNTPKGEAIAPAEEKEKARSRVQDLRESETSAQPRAEKAPRSGRRRAASMSPGSNEKARGREETKASPKTTRSHRSSTISHPPTATRPLTVRNAVPDSDYPSSESSTGSRSPVSRATETPATVATSLPEIVEGRAFSLDPKDRGLVPTDTLFATSDKISVRSDSESIYSTSTISLTPHSALLALNKVICTKDSELTVSARRIEDTKSRLVSAEEQIRALESELARNNDVVTESLAQTFRSQEEVRALSAKVAVLEEAQRASCDNIKGASKIVDQALRSQIEDFRSDRDRAMQQVEEIRKLLDATM
ncbi:hypothetical protein PLICRDRAFT_242460 [Plicaturopsis crispa FD-325 SS-3]|nr:hypothetical protein PLICRDRAFT_242460 [Plicaturopsis crispa FD-325 SS-3]